MWKHVWEASFPMTEEEYDAQLEAVAWFITEWGKADYLRNEIATTDQSPGNRRVFQRDIRGECLCSAIFYFEVCFVWGFAG